MITEFLSNSSNVHQFADRLVIVAILGIPKMVY